MYRILISYKDGEKFGIDYLSKEFYLNSAEDVCNVIKSLSTCKVVYTLQEVVVSSVDDVLSNFLSKEV